MLNAIAIKKQGIPTQDLIIIVFFDHPLPSAAVPGWSVRDKTLPDLLIIISLCLSLRARPPTMCIVTFAFVPQTHLLLFPK